MASSSPPSAKPRALDLFCGKGSVTKALQQNGFEVVSVDINPNFNPTHPIDILEWDYWRYPKGYFRVIAASVPCTEYSQAKTVGIRKLAEADKLVLKTLEIIEFFQPDLWWLENPRTGMLPRRACAQNLPYVDLDYCQFSDWGYQKPTRFWGSENLGRLENKLCDPKDCPNVIPGRRKHRHPLGGDKMIYGTHQKWRIPSKLVEYLISALHLTEEKFNFKREDYAVRNEIVEMIEKNFHVKADRDCFASHKNARCSSYFSKEKDALKKEWGPGETLWMNPPWSLWRKVAEKLRTSKCDAICILPTWLGEGIIAEGEPENVFSDKVKCHQPLYPSNLDVMCLFPILKGPKG